MPRYIDVNNTAPRLRFDDSTVLSDGLAHFASSLLNAGPAAAQIRGQREAQSATDADRDRALALAETWRQREWDRQGDRDATADLWRTKDMQRQQERDAVLDQDRSFQRGLDLFNTGAKQVEVARAGQPKPGTKISDKDAYALALQLAKAEAGDDEMGNPVPVNADRVQEYYEGILSGKIGTPKPPAGDAQPEAAEADGGWPMLPTAVGAAGLGYGLYRGGKALLRGGAAPPVAGAPSVMSRIGNALRMPFQPSQALNTRVAPGRVPLVSSATPASTAASAAVPILMAKAWRDAAADETTAHGGADPGFLWTGLGARESQGYEGAPAEVQAYAQGAKKIRPGMATRAMQILGTFDRNAPDQEAEARRSQLMGAVNALIPPAQTPQQEAKRQALIGRIEQATFEDDPATLQALLTSLFAN